MRKGFVLIYGILILLSLLTIVCAQVNVTDYDLDGYNLTIDCDDNNSLIYVNVSGYMDNDLDNYGAGNLTVFCTNGTLAIGIVNNSLDCNDNDFNVWKNITGYMDRDNDGFGDFNAIEFCTLNLVYGYSNLSNDCDDTNPLKYPNASELCNSVDDNCNNNIDENFLDKGQNCSVGIGECRNAGVMICNINGTGTRCKATPKSPSMEVCDGKDNDCDNSTDEDGVCNITDIAFNLFNPTNNIYNTNNILVNLSLTSNPIKIADKIVCMDNDGLKIKEILLCKRCNSYGNIIKKVLNLKDGNHTLLFTAFYNDTNLNKNISVFIDSRKPKITLPPIRKKLYINENFNISYEEINVKSVSLLYKNKNVTNNNCPSGKNQYCSIYANLSEYEGKDIIFNYLVEDIAGNVVITKNLTGEVDLTPPKIELVSYPVIGNYVYFRFNITEKNFKDISYYDNSDDNPKWKILCSVLKNQICEKEQRLTPGEHNITIRISDRAGNFVDYFV